jgi:hypothetical protein
MLQTVNIQATESFLAIYVMTHARNGFYNPDTKKNSKTARKEKLLHQNFIFPKLFVGGVSMETDMGRLKVPLQNVRPISL